jgi:signal transduction histidine kinase/DNA-binding response OmpR family regulator
MPAASLARVFRAPPDLAAPLTARILIVDDDERNAFAAAQALEGLGYELVIARSGPEALRCLLEDEFAVILLDLHMPEMDGFETASMIRSRRRSMLTPIVFLTAIFRDEAHVFQAYSAGAVDVVFKPVDPFILRSKVKILADLRLKTAEIERQAAYQEWLLGERDRIEAERAETERRLRRSEARLSTIQGSLPIIFHARGVEPPYAPTFVGGAVREITGFTGEEFLTQPDLGSSHIHPDDLAGVVESVSSAMMTGAYACEFRWRCADGGYRLLQDQGVLAPANQDGEPTEIWGAIIDVTERRSLEEQLAQARKMEAVGQLTGGVAHDFNNLLTVILGNAEMLAERQEDPTKRDLRLEAIRQAADRGRTLTRQLLAFARRQHLNPEPCDVNALIQAFAPLLRHAVGEGVTVECDLGTDPYCATIDSAQLETALLNLGVNARDAMPEGGVLRIATREVSEGRQAWIEIEVSDTGLGMTSEVLERAFEPFFTTKALGLGSGLGLSQVHGFVNQSGGEVWLESVPGTGSAFRLRLPATPGPASNPRKVAPSPLPLGGSEVVLVVEDDSSVLALTVDMLKAQGYSVLTAADAAEALAALKAHPEVQVMFSDVTMPGMSGVGLARQALRAYPDLRILLTSGFVGDASGLGCEFPMLDKPFDSDGLAAALRRLLDASAPRKRRARRAGLRRAGAAG